MDRVYELDIKVTDNLIIRYIESDLIANVFINTKTKNLLTKSAHLMTFKGLLNLLAFFTQTDNYAINEDGIILYSAPIEINEDLYLQLEDNVSYLEELNTALPSKDHYQVTLNIKNKHLENDIEVASYSLNQNVIQLFLEIEDYRTNELYQNKLQVSDNTIMNFKTIM